MILAKHTERLHTKTRDAVIYVSANINFERLMSTLLCPGRVVMRFVQMYNIINEKSSLSTPGFQEKTDLVFQLLMIMLTKKRKSSAPPPTNAPFRMLSLYCHKVFTSTAVNRARGWNTTQNAAVSWTRQISWPVVWNKDSKPKPLQLVTVFCCCPEHKAFFSIQKAEESKILKVISLHFWLWSEKVKFNESLHKLITLTFSLWKSKRVSSFNIQNIGRRLQQLGQVLFFRTLSSVELCYVFVVKRKWSKKK